MKRLSSVLAGLLVLGMAATSFASEIAVKGSTTVQPIMQKAVEAFMAQHKGVSISISASGSGDGAKALIDGTTPLAMMSREMKASEIQQANAKGIHPKQIVIAYDCITPIVNSSNPVKNLSMAQRAEGHFDCFGRAGQGYCDQGDCAYHAECLSVSGLLHSL